jgi:uncharacterized protein YyaL (SSP411 family)
VRIGNSKFEKCCKESIYWEWGKIDNLEKELPKNRHAVDVLLETLRVSKEKNYLGWDKHDGMNSKMLEFFPMRSKWFNLLFQEIVKRFPVNIRPILLIKKERSFKGIALFALAYFNLYEIDNKDEYCHEALELVNWLKSNSAKGFSGFCGGHRHPRQQIDRFVPANTPAIVPTFFAVYALIKAYGVTRKPEYLNEAISAINFIINDLDYKEEGASACIKYKPGDKGSSYTLNANALGAHTLLYIYRENKDESLRKKALRILNYVSHKQKKGGWMYTDPPSASHVAMDNYHNGFIIESFWDYKKITDDQRFDKIIESATAFYRNVLFNDDGSPNWDNMKTYPKDIHACAEGIILFSRLGNIEFANKILGWTLENLYDGHGKFYYQKRKLYTNKTILMRWGQAWMSYALSTFLKTILKASEC